MRWGTAVLVLALAVGCGAPPLEKSDSNGEASGTDAAGTSASPLVTTRVLRFKATADAYVDETQPYSNFGGATSVRVNGGPNRDALLRFDVSGLQGQVTSATLRVYVTDGTANHAILWSAFHPFQEGSVTWSRHPGTVGASTYLGPASAGRWVEWRLPYFHTSDLDYVLRIDGTDELVFASRESATPPELVLVVESTPPLAVPLPPSNVLPRDGSPRVLLPVADATVDESRPTTALGGASSLSVDGSPRQYSLLRFNVGSLPAPIRSAKVRLHATGETVKGPALHATSGSWSESTVTWQTRPAPSGSAFGTAAAVRAGDWIEYDVTARVRGPGPYDFGLYATSDDGVTLHAREGGIAVARPQLVLELDVPPLATDACGSRPHLSEVEGHVEETYVSAAEPTVRFDSRATVRVDGNPREEGYLFAHVPAWSGRLVRAVIRLYADTETLDGPKLYRTAPWSRSDFNWNERPALVGGALADSARISAGGWVEFDVTAAITGEGTHGFALIPDSSDSVAFISYDAGNAYLAPPNLRPQLVLTSEVTPTCSRRGTGGATTVTRRVGGAGDELPDVFARAPDGGWVVVGSAANGGTFGGAAIDGSASLVVARYAADGTHRWTRVIARSGVRARDVVLTGLGNVMMVGTYEGTPDLGTGPLPGPYGSFFAKLSPEGAVVWTRGVTAMVCRGEDGCYSSSVWANAVTTDANGSLIATGAFYGSADFGGGPRDAGPSSYASEDPASGMFVVKLAWDGSHLWSQSVPGGYLGSEGHSLGTDANGNVLLGATLSNPGLEVPSVMKLSPRGGVLWTRSLQGARGSADRIAVLPDGAAGFRVRFTGQFTFAGTTHPNAESHETIDVLAVVGPDGSERASRGLPWLTLDDLTADTQGGLRALLRGMAVDLGAGPVGSPAVARFTPSLGVQWYRSFDPNLERLFLDGANVVGAFRRPVLHEGRWLVSPNQSWDTLLFQLGP